MPKEGKPLTKDYYGTKRISAKPMTRLAYNQYRGWTIPADEAPADEGYLVEYMDGGEPNHPAHSGYISWSPKSQFEAAYQPTDALSFGHAIVALKAGRRVARAGWNGKGMWLRFVEPYSHLKMTDSQIDPVTSGATLLPWIGMKTANNAFVPWLASQTDVLADDWQIVE